MFTFSRKKSSWPVLATVLILSLLVSACSGGEETTADKDKAIEQAEETGSLVLYTSRKEDFVKPLVEKFTKDTGIEVAALYSDAKIVNRIKEEANNVQADIFISNDVGEMEFLNVEKLLEGSNPKGIETIDSKYRAEDNAWFGLSARSRIFMYNKEMIKESELPQRIEDLADDKYKGQFMITRGGNGSMVAHVSALRKVWGDEKTSQWLAKLKENAGAIVEGHSDIRKAVGAGEFKFGLVNNYYYHQQLAEPSDNNVGALYPDQAAGEIGVFVNAAGVAKIKDGPNSVSAKQFLDWILLTENQKEFSFASKEVPLNPNVQTNEQALRINQYRTIDMNLSELGSMWADSKQLIEKAGLALELKK
jgi:iron(III) transport system substrate-binding protein